MPKSKSAPTNLDGKDHDRIISGFVLFLLDFVDVVV